MSAAITRTLAVRNVLGLHLRAAAALVQCANRFRSQVDLRLGTTTVDAKSIMGIMSLGATVGTRLEFSALGPDAAEALDAIEKLFADRFGEPE